MYLIPKLNENKPWCIEQGGEIVKIGNHVEVQGMADGDYLESIQNPRQTKGDH